MHINHSAARLKEVNCWRISFLFSLSIPGGARKSSQSCLWHKCCHTINRLTWWINLLVAKLRFSFRNKCRLTCVLIQLVMLPQQSKEGGTEQHLFDLRFLCDIPLQNRQLIRKSLCMGGNGGRGDYPTAQQFLG